MATLKKSRYISLGEDELNGIINILEHRADESTNEPPTPKDWMEAGFLNAVRIMKEQDYIDFPGTFVELFDVKCEEIFGKGDGCLT